MSFSTPSFVTINDYLPEEILYNIFSENLNLKERSVACQVCKLWNRLNETEVKIPRVVESLKRDVPTYIGYNNFKHQLLSPSSETHSISFIGSLKTGYQFIWKAQREKENLLAVVLETGGNGAKSASNASVVQGSVCKLETIWKKVPSNYGQCANQKDAVTGIDAIIGTEHIYKLEEIAVLEDSQLSNDSVRKAIELLNKRNIQSSAIDPATGIADARVFSAPLLTKGPYNTQDWKYI